MAKKENMASVLAFEKKLIPSDGYMYGCQWENITVKTRAQLRV
ncbi:MAG: CRISPR-associated protein Csy3, partial [Gammaproteobacteria bacterium]|nr:CRISPR-associated protein Csy3 [Gammaproteobacteria bacterium]